MSLNSLEYPHSSSQPPVLEKPVRRWPLPSWPIILLLALTLLYTSPREASELPTIPDSIEYTVGAQRFATLGHFNIAINSASFPSRYPPGFPVVFLSPLYAAFPTHLGVGILVVLAAAIAAMLAAYALGYRLAGEWGGVAAAVTLPEVPTFNTWSRVIMSDVPFFALGMLGAWLYMQMRAS
ncbi:MAG: hypothetical protein JO250_19515 [Armatimonadetes bacterium]|nr:hypothetical protein [Armatimonadota bacterium]